MGRILKLASLRYHTSDGRRDEVSFHECYASSWYDAILLLTTQEIYLGYSALLEVTDFWTRQ